MTTFTLCALAHSLISLTNGNDDNDDDDDADADGRTARMSGQ